MKLIRLIFILLFIANFVLAGCDHSVLSPKSINISNLYRKWYYDYNDGDEWIEFVKGDEFRYRYYRYYGLNSSINMYITKTGKYSLEEKDGKNYLKLTLYHRSGIDNSYTPEEIGGVYEIRELGDKEMVICDTRQSYGSAAYRNNGVYFDISQVTPKEKIIFDVPNELVSDKWYYDADDINKWVKFDIDGTCWHRHYQNYGSYSTINGYVSTKGKYRYSMEEDEVVIDICLDGEINRDYIVKKLTSNELILEKKSNSAAGQSWMYQNNGKYFRQI